MSSDRSPACDAAQTAVARVLGGLSPHDAVRVITQVVRALPSPVAGCPGGTTDTTAALLDLGAAVQTATLAHVAVLDAEHAFDATPALSARSWLRQTGRLSDREAGTVLSLARRLHTDSWRALPTVAAAVTAGDMTPAQAQAVATATRRAPVEVVPAVDQAVVETGAHLLPDELGRHVATVVDRLATQAAPLLEPGDPGQERFLRVQRGFDGWFHVHALLEPDAGAALLAALDPLAAPVVTQDADGEPIRDPRTRDQRRHDALSTLAGLFTTASLHQAATGADHEALVPRPRATLDVVLDLDRLTDLLHSSTHDPHHQHDAPTRLGQLPGTVARTSNGTPLSGPAAEHLCCDPLLSWTLIQTLDPPPRPGDTTATATDRHPGLAAAVRAGLAAISPALGCIPVAVLDAGRAQRLGSPIQRRKATLRDRGCVTPGCTTPAWLCELHHLTPWLHGGRTDLDDMALLCPSHHRFLHRHQWTLTHNPTTGRYQLQPPPAPPQPERRRPP